MNLFLSNVLAPLCVLLNFHLALAADSVIAQQLTAYVASSNSINATNNVLLEKTSLLEREAVDLLSFLKTYPGTPQTTFAGRTLVKNANSNQITKSDIALMSTLESPRHLALSNAFKFLVYSGDSLNLGAQFKEDTVKTFLKLLRHEAQGPSRFIDCSIWIDLLTHFSERKWLNINSVDIKRLYAKNEKARHAWAEKLKSRDERTAAKEELKMASELMKEIVALAK